MATWEPKLPSFHETSSLWSHKSAAAAADHISHHHHIAWSPLGSTTSGSSPPVAADKPLLKSSSSPPLPRQFTGKMDQSTDVYSSDTPGGEATGTGTGAGTGTGTNPRGNATKSSLLGASGALGTGSTKVAKKRARASRKPPTTVLEADSSNFRAMVQQLTGIPSVPFLSSSLHQRNGGLDFLDVGMRPPTATRSLLGFGPQSLQGLPPLDPSALLPAFGSRDHGPGFGSSASPSPPYFKYLPGSLHEQPRPPQTNPSMGDFLRTPLDELGLDQTQHDPQQQQQQQRHQQRRLDLPGKMESLSMPLVWEGGGAGSGDGSMSQQRELQLDEMSSKFKLDHRHGDGGADHGGDDGNDQDGSSSSRMVHIVDSWLSSHADQATTDKH